MKRSEMIKMMVDRYYDYIDTKNTGDTNPYIMMNQILSTNENAGMLPPDIAACGCEDCGGPMYCWEPEDGQS